MQVPPLDTLGPNHVVSKTSGVFVEEGGVMVGEGSRQRQLINFQSVSQRHYMGIYTHLSVIKL